MTLIRPLVLLALLLPSAIVSAADQNGLFSIRGAGLLTCKTYVEEREAESSAYTMIGGWLDGYITAINELSKDTFDITPYESTELLTVLIDRHCRENPADIVFAVTNNLLAKLFDDRLKTSSGYVYVRVGLDQIRLYSDTVVRIQEALVGKGLLDIDATGEWNLATQKALARFQESVGMNATGFPDQTTLWNLLRSA